MSLRQRIVLSLLALTVVLVAPAVYGIHNLGVLQQIARELRTRDAVGALALGKVQAGLGEAEYQQRIYIAYAADPLGAAVQRQVDEAIQQVDGGLSELVRAGYQEPVAPALRRWTGLREAIREQQRAVEQGDIRRADQYQRDRITPAFAALAQALDPVGEVLNRRGEAQVQRAQEVASVAATTTRLALAAALALSLGIAGWLARGLLGPIGELRRGMGRVAEGDLDPHMRISPSRPDELGDLARSFRAMTRQLAELDRLKAEFVSIASHELKTPLSVIRGYTSLLLEGIYGPTPEAQQKALLAIDGQTDRLTRLVQRLLDISRFEAGGGRLELRPLAIRPFLNELTDDFSVLAGQNRMDFACEIDTALPQRMIADPDRLNEVIGNLLSNAFKFTPAGGRIRLRAERLGTSLRVEVEDSGVGIPADKLPKIFEKFFQVENEAQPRSAGSGLGLAISREIVEAHGGTISAESEPGNGTTFQMILPLDASARNPVEAAQSLAR